MRYAEECAALDLEAKPPERPWQVFWPAARQLRRFLSMPSSAPSRQRRRKTSWPPAKKAIRSSNSRWAARSRRPRSEFSSTLAEALPAGCRLRLDANGAWDEITAVEFLAACERLPVESLEEPLRDPDPAALDRLRKAPASPLALDESLARLPGSGASRPIAGTPSGAQTRPPWRNAGPPWPARQARDAGITCVVTSALAPVVSLAAAHLAAAVAAGSDREVAHGLATAGWFATDTGTPPPVVEVALRLPDRPGLGFVPVLS